MVALSTRTAEMDNLLLHALARQHKPCLPTRMQGSLRLLVSVTKQRSAPLCTHALQAAPTPKT